MNEKTSNFNGVLRALSIFSLLKFTYVELRGRVAIKVEFKDNLHEAVYYYVVDNGCALQLTHQ